jgi:hypothetical protein
MKHWTVKIFDFDFFVFNATFNNHDFSYISWRPVLMVKEAGVPGKSVCSSDMTKQLL